MYPSRQSLNPTKQRPHMHWHHMKCAIGNAASPDAIKGFQRLRWKDQVEMAEAMHCQPCDTADVARPLARTQAL